MQYIRLATYDLTRGTFPELVELTQKGMLPRLGNEPGFIKYGVADIGDHKVTSISIWETREQAEKAAGIAATWVKDNVGDRVRLLSNTVGDLAFFHGAPVAA
jgi:hypothetical protein